MTVDVGRTAQELVDCHVVIQGGRQARVLGQSTSCPNLLITPRLEARPDGALSFSDGLVLTHVPTGATLVGGESATRLLALAELLARFDWSFTDFGNVTLDTLDEIRNVVRQWRLAAADSIPAVSLYGEDEAQRAERENRPARTLLAEHLDWWQRHNDNRVMPPLSGDDPDQDRAWNDGLATSIEGFGLIYLMAVLWRTNPTVADIAARMLIMAWDAGDDMGEWVYQWRTELASDNPLTLHAIPEADALEFLAAADSPQH
ncbi:hypothetical protein ACNQVK_01260 [Mycobacterium sp. 134]|uniref:hypothetical protein n=1 Tax=Mycobacterium sp. 134 TaxID=3400425 RepID=UPI003AAF4E87